MVAATSTGRPTARFDLGVDARTGASARRPTARLRTDPARETVWGACVVSLGVTSMRATERWRRRPKWVTGPTATTATGGGPNTSYNDASI